MRDPGYYVILADPRGEWLRGGPVETASEIPWLVGSLLRQLLEDGYSLADVPGAWNAFAVDEDEHSFRQLTEAEEATLDARTKQLRSVMGMHEQ
jgi:hypothetical protein